jgi:hypothetical protein
MDKWHVPRHLTLDVLLPWQYNTIGEIQQYFRKEDGRGRSDEEQNITEHNNLETSKTSNVRAVPRDDDEANRKRKSMVRHDGRGRIVGARFESKAPCGRTLYFVFMKKQEELQIDKQHEHLIFLL